MRTLKPKIIVILLFISNCIYAQMRSYPGRDRVNKEVITLKLLDTKEKQGFSAIALAAAPFIVDKVFSAIDTIKAKKLAEFSAEYEANASGDNLFASFTQMDAPTLLLERTILEDGESNPDVVVQIELIPELSVDKKAFRYKTGAVKFKKSKARYQIKRNLGFKKVDQYLNLNIDVSFKVFQEGKTYSEQDLGTRSLTIQGIQPDEEGKALDIEELKTGWFPMPKYDFVVEKEDVFFASEDKKNELFDLYTSYTGLDELFKFDTIKTNGLDALQIEEKRKAVYREKFDTLTTSWLYNETNNYITKLGKIDGWYFEIKKSPLKSGNYTVSVKVIENNPDQIRVKKSRETAGIVGKYTKDVTDFVVEQLKDDEEKETKESEDGGS